MKKAIVLFSMMVAVGLGAQARAATTYNFDPNPKDLYDLDHNSYYAWNVAWGEFADQKITSATITIKQIDDWTTESGDILFASLLTDNYYGSNPNTSVVTVTDSQADGDAWTLASEAAASLFTYSDPEPNPAVGTVTTGNLTVETLAYADPNYKNGRVYVPGVGNRNWGSDGLISTAADGVHKLKSPQNVTYTLTQSQLDVLNTLASDGKFALGFDPDCHYYNNGISLSFEAESTLEGGGVVPEPGTLVLLGSGLLGLGGVARRKRPA